MSAKKLQLIEALFKMAECHTLCVWRGSDGSWVMYMSDRSFACPNCIMYDLNYWIQDWSCIQDRSHIENEPIKVRVRTLYCGVSKECRELKDKGDVLNFVLLKVAPLVESGNFQLDRDSGWIVVNV